MEELHHETRLSLSQCLLCPTSLRKSEWAFPIGWRNKRNRWVFENIWKYLIVFYWANGVADHAKNLYIYINISTHTHTVQLHNINISLSVLGLNQQQKISLSHPLGAHAGQRSAGPSHPENLSSSQGYIWKLPIETNTTHQTCCKRYGIFG